MDWLSWVPSPLRSRRKSAEAQRRRDRRPVIETAVGRPLVFNTSQDACVRRPHGAALASRVLLGLGDGAPARGSAQLPSELLGACKQIAEDQLLQPNGQPVPQKEYQGPIVLLKEAFEATQSPGSTTVALATLDNSTVIHGQIHPMVAMLTIGGCELLQLRRRDNDGHAPTSSQASPPEACPEKKQCRAESERKRDPADGDVYSLEEIKDKYDGIYSEDNARDYFSTVCEALPPKLAEKVETVQVQGEAAVASNEFEIVFRAPPPKCSSPVVLGRGFYSEFKLLETLETIEAKSSIRCASARQGDIIILLSADILTDVRINCLLALCDETLVSTSEPVFTPTSPEMLRKLARRIAKVCPAESGFIEGQQVQCRDLGDNKWLEGTVKSLKPLRVQPTACATLNAPCTWDEVRVPQAASTPNIAPTQFSIVVAEVVEWAGDDLSSSSCETVLEKAVLDASTSPDDWKGGVSPVIEGLEDMKTVQCSMNIGEFGVLFQPELPKALMPTLLTSK